MNISFFHYNLAFVTNICDLFSYLSKLSTFNLQDLLIFCSYLALDSSILDLIILCFGVLTFTLPLVLFSGRAGKILDAAAKVVVILAGGSNVYKNHGGGSSSNDDSDTDKDKDKDNKKDKTNDDKNDNETKKTNDSNSDSNTASKE